MGRAPGDGPPGLPCRRRGRCARRRRLADHSLRRQPRAPQRRGDAARADGAIRRDAGARRLGPEERQRIDRPGGRAPSAALHRLRLDLARASGRTGSGWDGDDPRLLQALDALLASGRFKGIGEISAVHFPSPGFAETDYDPMGATMIGILALARKLPRAGAAARRVDADARALEPAREVSRRRRHLGARRLHAALHRAPDDRAPSEPRLRAERTHLAVASALARLHDPARRQECLARVAGADRGESRRASSSAPTPAIAARKATP